MRQTCFWTVFTVILQLIVLTTYDQFEVIVFKVINEKKQKT